MGFNEYNQFFGFLKSFSDPDFFQKTFNNFNQPSFDFSSLSDKTKKNLETLAKANQIASANFQEFLKKGSEIFKKESEALFNNFKNVASSENPEQASEKHREYLKNALNNSVNNGKDLFDWFSKSSNDLLNFLGQNFEQNFDKNDKGKKNPK